MKQYRSCETVEFGLTGALSTGIPDRPKFRLGQTFTLLAAAVLFYGAAFSLAQPAKADGSFTVAGINSTLPGWSQAKSEQSSQSDQQLADDPAISALRTFAQRVGASEPQSIKDQPKLAAADNLIDWLKEGSPAPGTSTSKGPVAGGKQADKPVEATFVGAKACLSCHASQAAEFQKTLMGRIGKTQKGKFDCENCHGPGSAHVKAGGGRGVGGIISFRPNDQSRTAEENNGICLTCHQRGDRTYWSGSTHETRGLMCTNCHTVMKTGVAQIPNKDGVRARHLLPVPQGSARADVPLVAYAAARRQDGVLGLP